MQAKERSQRAAELGSGNDGVNKTVVLKIFSRLKVIGQFLAQRLFDHPTASETNQGFGLSQNQIAQHGKTGGNTPGGWVSEQR
jgi:hypothetical protein